MDGVISHFLHNIVCFVQAVLLFKSASAKPGFNLVEFVNFVKRL